MSNHQPPAPPESPPLAAVLAQTEWTRRLARNLTADADADDLVQETLLAAVKRPPRPDRSLRPWLGTVARNLLAKRRRAQRRRGAREAVLVPDATEAAPSPAELMDRLDLQRALVDLVAALDEPYRQTVLLRYFEGHTAPIIAGLMKVPEGTVRWRLKTALDRLRQRLDERYGGPREAWVRAFLPLLAPRPALRQIPRGGLGALLAGLAGLVSITGGLLLGRELLGTAPTGGPAGAALTAVAPDRVNAGAASGAPLGGPGAPGGTPALAALVGNLEDCQAEVRRLRGEAAAVTTKHLVFMPPNESFAAGTPNPAAAKELAPLISRLLTRPGGRALSHTLECRTRACRLRVLLTEEESDSNRFKGWDLPLQHDPQLGQRTLGMMLSAPIPSKDPISGADLSETVITLKLADPSGSPVASDAPPPPDRRPLPSELGRCRQEQGQLTGQIAELRGKIEPMLPPFERFQMGTANPGLAEQLRALVGRQFPPGDPANTQDVQCRGQICRIVFPRGVNLNTARTRLMRDVEFGARLDGGSMGPDGFYFAVAPGPRASGIQHIQRLVDALEASGAVASCAARFPGPPGVLLARFHLPGTEEKNEHGGERPLEVRFSDALAGTPVGHCIAAEVDQRIVHAPLPALPVGATVVFHRFEIPVKKPVSRP